MSTTSEGRGAEREVADTLVRKGHTILSMNWRTRWCEIDIVSKKGEVVYFTEVKYRSSSAQGGGLDYITSKKLSQMRFAAELWMTQHKWEGEVELLAAEVASDYNVTIVEP